MTVTRPATPLASPVDLGSAWNASDDEVAARFHPSYRAALGRLPEGDVVLRGIPFAFGCRDSGRRWMLLDRELVVPLPERPATHLVVAHFADSWRDEEGRRPEGVPVGWVVGTGEKLATYEVFTAEDHRRAFDIRRRFEIGDGIVAWGSLPFAAIGHRDDEVLDWRGPHARLPAGRYPPAGLAGALSMLPGSWGMSQTGVADFVPSPDDDVMLWLHALELDRDMRPTELHLRPPAAGRPGSDVVIAGVTLFSGTANPLVRGPRRQVLVQGFDGLPDVDLGIAIRSGPLLRSAERGSRDATPIGWGTTPLGSMDEPSPEAAHVVDLAAAPDARLRMDGWEVPLADLDRRREQPAGTIRIEPLPAADIRVTVEVRDAATHELAPARLRFVAADGRYLPPVGHRDEVNPAIYEDSGADLVLGTEIYAYVPGTFDIELPLGSVDVEIVKGFDYRPLRHRVTVEPDTRAVSLAIDRPIDLRPAGWVTADPHVHFLAPSTALLQAAAEDVGLVHVLATQWGDQFTSVPDLAWGSTSTPDGRHAVVVGTENRQNVLGHVGLLGAHRPILPMASGGAPEGRIAGAVTELMADWMDRCRAEGGVVIASHFPLPYAEVASDIVTGKVDAVEMQTLPPRFDTPSILEWYRYLNCGYRLPVVGGTDKMSAELPIGGIRTYARLEPGEPLSFEAWARALRAGRTFATSGPVIEFVLDGREPGDVVRIGSSGGRFEAQVRARAAQRIITAVEVVMNGVVVARRDADGSTDALDLDASIEVPGSAWIAARTRSNHAVNSAFATSMAAHTAPIYVEVADRPLFAASDAEAILEVIDGTLRWLRDWAAVPTESERQRMVGFVEDSADRLRRRIGSSA
jgi:hypothetical protein